MKLKLIIIGEIKNGIFPSGLTSVLQFLDKITNKLFQEGFKNLFIKYDGKKGKFENYRKDFIKDQWGLI